jgi:Tetracyclin repressor-like, C-terminal domain
MSSTGNGVAGGTSAAVSGKAIPFQSGGSCSGIGATGPHTVGAAALALLMPSPAARQAVTEQNVTCGARKGCLLGNFATELAPHSVGIANAVTEAPNNWSAVVAQALVQAQEAGELSKDADVGALARFLVDSYEGAAARAKLIGDRAPMDEFIRTTFDFLLA